MVEAPGLIRLEDAVGEAHGGAGGKKSAPVAVFPHGGLEDGAHVAELGYGEAGAAGQHESSSG